MLLEGGCVCVCVCVCVKASSQADTSTGVANGFSDLGPSGHEGVLPLEGRSCTAISHTVSGMLSCFCDCSYVPSESQSQSQPVQENYKPDGKHPS